MFDFKYNRKQWTLDFLSAVEDSKSLKVFDIKKKLGT